MIYITGDTHTDFSRFSKRRMRYALTADDYLIVCGDFGLLWAEDNTLNYHLKLFASRPYTILWVSGNHENYDLIARYPKEYWHGGIVRHIVRDKVILLERGQLFELEGKRFFTFGGASSHDMPGGILDLEDPDFSKKRSRAKRRGLMYRVNHISWWKEELPNEEELAEGRKNLETVHYQVDYVITHCAPTRIQKKIEAAFYKEGEYHSDLLTDYFQELESRLQYKQWIFGHYHVNAILDSRHTVLYEEIIPLELYEQE